MKRNNNRKKGISSDSRSTLVLMVLFIVGISLLLYPSVADYWNSFHQSRAIAGYVEQVANMDNGYMEQMVTEAQGYNAMLVGNQDRFSPSEEQNEYYNSLLNITGTGIMGYVKIDKIGVSLPIYHGTDDSVLQRAIGHIEGTSLPVGGTGTHCVISGHRGLPSAVLFTHIDELQQGDEFELEVLGETYTYLVDLISVVEPHDVSLLEIDPLMDYVTLVTCTPYGINTHRLLVRGHRIDTEIIYRVSADAIQMDPVYAELVIGGGVLFVLLITLLIRHRPGRKKKPIDDDDSFLPWEDDEPDLPERVQTRRASAGRSWSSSAPSVRRRK